MGVQRALSLLIIKGPEELILIRKFSPKKIFNLNVKYPWCLRWGMETNLEFERAYKTQPQFMASKTWQITNNFLDFKRYGCLGQCVPSATEMKRHVYMLLGIATEARRAIRKELVTQEDGGSVMLH